MTTRRIFTGRLLCTSMALSAAMAAHDSRQAQGRKAGVISHVAEMTERIGTRIDVVRLAGGRCRRRSYRRSRASPLARQSRIRRT